MNSGIPSNQDIENRFTYHKPFGSQQFRYEKLRNKAKELAHLIDDACPNSREKSLALTELEACVMWANAAIARNERENSETQAPQTIQSS